MLIILVVIFSGKMKSFSEGADKDSALTAAGLDKDKLKDEFGEFFFLFDITFLS